MDFEEVTHTNIVILPKQNGSKLLWHFAKKAAAWIRKKFWLVLLCTTVTTAGAFVSNEIRTPLFEASGIYTQESPGLAFEALTAAVALDESAMARRVIAELTAPDRLRKLASDENVASVLKTELSPPAIPTPERFANALSVRHDAQTHRFAVTARDPNPEMAVALVRALVLAHNHELPATESLKNATQTLTRTRLSAHEEFLKDARPDILATPPATASATPPPTTTRPETTTTAVTDAIVLTPDSIAPDPQSAELQSELAKTELRLTALRRLQNGVSATDLAVAGSTVRASYHAIGAARGKLQNALKQYQVPAGEKTRMESVIAAAQSRFTQTVKSSIAAELSRKADLETRITSKTGGAEGLQSLSSAVATMEARAAAYFIGRALRPKPEPEPVAATSAAPVPAPVDESALADVATLLHGLSSTPGFPARLLVAAEPALPLFPVIPDKARVLFVAAVCGFIVGCALAAFVGFKDEAVTSPADIEREFAVPVLGVIPKARAS